MPTVPGSKLSKPGDKFISPDDTELSQFLYREAVGDLLWFARTGRTGILNAVSQVSRSMGFHACYSNEENYAIPERHY